MKYTILFLLLIFLSSQIYAEDGNSGNINTLCETINEKNKDLCSNIKANEEFKINNQVLQSQEAGVNPILFFILIVTTIFNILIPLAFLIIIAILAFLIFKFLF